MVYVLGHTLWSTDTDECVMWVVGSKWVLSHHFSTMVGALFILEEKSSKDFSAFDEVAVCSLQIVVCTVKINVLWKPSHSHCVVFSTLSFSPHTIHSIWLIMSCFYASVLVLSSYIPFNFQRFSFSLSCIRNCSIFII